MLVSDLTAALEGKNERSLESRLGDIQVADDSSRITLESGEEFIFDEQLERAFSGYLGINKSYLAKCPPDLKAYNVNWWLQATKRLRSSSRPSTITSSTCTSPA